MEIPLAGCLIYMRNIDVPGVIGKVAIHGREYLVAVKPHKQGLVMYTLHHAAEIRGIEAVDESAKYSWVKSPRWKGHAMEVGPLARYVVGYAMGRPEFKEPVDMVLKKLDVPITGVRVVVHPVPELPGGGWGNGPTATRNAAAVAASGGRLVGTPAASPGLLSGVAAVVVSGRDSTGGGATGAESQPTRTTTAAPAVAEARVSSDRNAGSMRGAARATAWAGPRRCDWTM